MKTHFIWILTLLLALPSCSSDNTTENQTENPKNVTNCDLDIEATTAVSICVDGTDFALPDEVIKFASTYYSRDDSASNSEFLWTIESGSMEILNTETTIDGQVAKSIATIKFNSDYSGNGVILVNAENNTANGSIKHMVELESNQ